jgi:hypothetical protein
MEFNAKDVRVHVSRETFQEQRDAEMVSWRRRKRRHCLIFEQGAPPALSFCKESKGWNMAQPLLF